MRGFKALRKQVVALAVVVFALFTLTLDGYASESAVSILQRSVSEDSVSLYLKYNGQDQSAQAQVGTESAGTVALEGSDSFPIVTWLLLDNSISISQGDRDKAKALFTDLVADRASTETFSLCTYDEHLNVLCRDSSSYGDLKGQIDSIQHIDQESYLTDVLSELLDLEEQREEDVFFRVVVICDGVDNNPGGITRDELNRRLAENNVPVYTLGCERQGNEQLLKELYSLSRETGARSWSLTGLNDTLEVSNALSREELPVRASLEIPAGMRDGSEKGIQLTFSDGSTVSTTAVMPFGEEVPEPVPEPSPEPEPTPTPEPMPEPEPKDNTPIFLAVGIAALCCAAAVIIFLVLRRRKKNNEIRPVAYDDSGGETELFENMPDGDTAILVGEDRSLRLILTDTSDPNHHFEVPLRGKITIGRDPANRICLDYDRTVSGKHCEIYREGGSFWIRDLKSRNKTYVDDTCIVDVGEIANGSVITLGRVRLTVEIR